MRKLTDHIVSGDQASQLAITANDVAGSGGANHLYVISGFSTATNPSGPVVDGFADGDGKDCTVILFQNGPIKEAGVNGVTQEALLAIVIDRLRSFQAGPFQSMYNATALAKCEEALMWLQKRTIERIKRGVEGTHTA